MKFIITSGSTYTPWDSVRGITNLSKGTTGAKIAEQALLNGHSVDYIANENAVQPFERKINPNNIGSIETLKEVRTVYQNYTYSKARTFEDYLNSCLTVPLKYKDEKMVFISSAAVSDFAPVKADGKISSNCENIHLKLEKLPKVIREVKKAHPQMPIVGFKLLSTENSNETELIEVAYQSLLDGNLSLVVANLVDESFRPQHTVIIDPDKKIIPISNRNDLAPRLVEIIDSTIH